MSWAYYLMTENLDQKARRQLDQALRPNRLTVIDDPDLPESMQGLRPPAFWSDGPAVEGTIRGLNL